MARYQIRTPVEKVIEDVVNEMAAKAWGFLMTWNPSDFAQASDADFRLFRDGVRRSMSGRVKTYKLCGLSNVCLDEVTSTPWAADEHVLEADPRDHVYHLFTTRELDEFLKELALDSLVAAGHLIGPNEVQEALSNLCIVFRSVLGEYLYYNRVCGRTELCIFSSSAPINLWT